MSSSIQCVIEPRSRDLGDFSVRRVLPAPELQSVGPFIFFDHMGPADFGPGQGVNVRPHPHIGLATVTYLYEGAFMHRDSLGTAQLIRPGDVNWMVAGRGIVHSERTPPEVRDAAGRTRAHGIQTWVALPRADEEREPSFAHHGAASLPRLEQGGVKLPSPEDLDDAALASKLWGVIHALARFRTFLESTNHLSDRKLYTHLWQDSLRESTPCLPAGSGWNCHLDLIGSGSDEDNDLYLRYYADAETREHWRADFPKDEIPPHEDPPFDRDRLLPRPGKNG